MVKILFFGDVVGKSGRRAVAAILPELKKQYRPDLVIANGENLAHGKGLTIKTFEELLKAGVDFFTSGNHVFDKPEASEVFAKYSDKIIRPANFEGKLQDGSALPGEGLQILHLKTGPVLIMNLNGQVFMEKQFDYGEIKNPFLEADRLLSKYENEAIVRILDFHSEATSEKRAMGIYIDGRVSAVVGTHTHVQTADAQILPNGTGYLSDVGMVGAADSVIGVKSGSAIKRFIMQVDGSRTSLEIDEGEKFEIGFAVVQIDGRTGKCKNIESRLVFQK